MAELLDGFHALLLVEAIAFLFVVERRREVPLFTAATIHLVLAGLLLAVAAARAITTFGPPEGATNGIEYAGVYLLAPAMAVIGFFVLGVVPVIVARAMRRRAAEEQRLGLG